MTPLGRWLVFFNPVLGEESCFEDGSWIVELPLADYIVFFDDLGAYSSDTRPVA